MKPLALDLATVTGWAMSLEESGVWDLTPARGDSSGLRYILLRSHLNRVLEAHPDLGLVVMEQAHHRGGAATAILVKLAGTVETWCLDHGIEHMSTHTATLKKWATGRGNAGKDEMIQAAKARGLVNPSDDNHADAFLLLEYAKELVR